MKKFWKKDMGRNNQERASKMLALLATKWLNEGANCQKEAIRLFTINNKIFLDWTKEKGKNWVIPEEFWSEELVNLNIEGLTLLHLTAKEGTLNKIPSKFKKVKNLLKESTCSEYNGFPAQFVEEGNVFYIQERNNLKDDGTFREKEKQINWKNLEEELRKDNEALHEVEGFLNGNFKEILFGGKVREKLTQTLQKAKIKKEGEINI